MALLAARRARSAGALEQARRAVAEVVLTEARIARWSRVAAYEPLRTEPGSLELLERLDAEGVEVIVPVTLPDRDLDWRNWSSRSAAAAGSMGVDAVARADAVLVPALAVGRDGARLGRGGGSYDRALRRCSPGTDLLALVFDGEVLDALPTASWDVSVNAAITPTGRVPLGGVTPGNTAVVGDS